VTIIEKDGKGASLRGEEVHQRGEGKTQGGRWSMNLDKSRVFERVKKKMRGRSEELLLGGGSREYGEKEETIGRQVLMVLKPFSLGKIARRRETWGTCRHFSEKTSFVENGGRGNSIRANQFRGYGTPISSESCGQ